MWALIRFYSIDSLRIVPRFLERFSFIQSRDGVELIPDSNRMAYAIDPLTVRFHRDGLLCSIPAALISVVVFDEGMNLAGHAVDFSLVQEIESYSHSFEFDKEYCVGLNSERFSLKAVISEKETLLYVSSIRLQFR